MPCPVAMLVYVDRGCGIVIFNEFPLSSLR